LWFQIWMREHKGNRIFRENKLIKLTEHEMRARYQFGIESFNYLLDLWRGTHKKSALSVKEQLLIALLFYARGSFLHVIPLALTRVQHTRAVEFVTNAFCQGTRGSQEPVIAHLVFNLTSKVDRKWGCYT
jgi:hypothetical protein